MDPFGVNFLKKTNVWDYANKVGIVELSEEERVKNIISTVYAQFDEFKLSCKRDYSALQPELIDYQVNRITLPIFTAYAVNTLSKQARRRGCKTKSEVEALEDIEDIIDSAYSDLTFHFIMMFQEWNLDESGGMPVFSG